MSYWLIHSVNAPTYSSCGGEEIFDKISYHPYLFHLELSSCNFWLFPKITNKEEISDGSLRDNEVVDGDYKSGFCRLF